MPILATWCPRVALRTYLSNFHHFGEGLMEPMYVLEVLEVLEELLLMATALRIFEIAVGPP